MNLINLTGDATGLVHLLASMVALLTGTMNLTLRKGTARHQKIGYIYSVAMIIMLVTAFMIYRLFGGWGIFHWSAVASALTLIAGMIPVMIKKPAANYISLHFGFMYWSVIGLYGAFAGEIFTRLPKLLFKEDDSDTLFFKLVGISFGLIMAVGAYFFIKFKPKWDKIFTMQMKK